MMEKDLFDELLASVSEAGAILRGEREPARTTSLDAETTDMPDSPNPRKIREQFNLTRPQFAALIGVSERTVEGWEQGRRRPSGPALTLLRVAARHPESVLDTIRHTPNS